MRRYRSATQARRSGSVTAMKNHGCRFPPLGANVPASHTLRINSGGTGSGLSRRIARVVRMPSKSGTSSPMRPIVSRMRKRKHRLRELSAISYQLSAVSFPAGPPRGGGWGLIAESFSAEGGDDGQVSDRGRTFHHRQGADREGLQV